MAASGVRPLSEAEDIRRKRLVHRSRYRGVKESDLLFGQFADTPSGAARRRRSSTATRRCSTSPTRTSWPGSMPGSPSRRGTTTTCSPCCAASSRRVSALRSEDWSTRRRGAGAAAPAAWRRAAGPRARRSGGRCISRRACAAATPPASCTSSATGRASRFSPAWSASSRPRSRSSASRPGTACPTTGSRPIAAIMAERLRALVRLAAGPGRKPRLILTTANAMVQKVPPPERGARHPFPRARRWPHRSRRAARLSRAQRLPPDQCRGRGRRLCRPRRPGRHLPERAGPARAARLLRLDPRIDPLLRPADPALAGARSTSSS